MNAYKSGKFQLDDMIADEPCPVWPGAWVTDQRWNGFAQPAFTAQVCADIARYVNRANNDEQVWVDVENGLVLDISDPDDPYEIYSETCLVDGAETVLFWLGTGYWIWDEAE